MESLIHTLLLEKEYVEFLVGRNGDFDQIVSSAVKRQQRRVRDDNSALILVLPYPTTMEQYRSLWLLRTKKETHFKLVERLLAPTLP